VRGSERRDLRISQINYCLKVGGAETMTVELCRIFRDRGHEVQVHCLDEDGPLGDRLRGDGFRVSYHGPAHPLAAARSLYRTLREFRPDVVHIHNTGAMIIAAPVARLAGVPVIVGTRHGLGHARERLATLLYFGLAVACCSRVVGVCRAATERMARQPFVLKRRLSTILNGAAAAPLSAPESDLRRHSFTLLWLGRLSEPKDPFTLLRAWVEVRRAVPDCHLLIAGDGELRAPSELLARQLGLEAEVSFLGMRRDVGALLEASDAFVLSRSWR